VGYLVLRGFPAKKNIPNEQAFQEELAKRKTEWKPRAPHYSRGYGSVFLQHVTQADKGCDFDFLHHGAPTPEPDTHH